MYYRLELNNGKYTIILNDGPLYEFKAFRYGEEWRDLVGDGLILSLVHKIIELESNKMQK